MQHCDSCSFTQVVIHWFSVSCVDIPVLCRLVCTLCLLTPSSDQWGCCGQPLGVFCEKLYLTAKPRDHQSLAAAVCGRRYCISTTATPNHVPVSHGGKVFVTRHMEGGHGIVKKVWDDRLMDIREDFMGFWYPIHDYVVIGLWTLWFSLLFVYSLGVHVILVV